MRSSISRLGALALCLMFVAGAAACGGSTETPSASAPIDFSKPGPYQVGITTLDLGDRIAFAFYPADPNRLSEGTKVTSYSSGDAFPAALRAAIPKELVQEVPISATKDAPIATDGPFPILIHSHGFGGYPQYASQHLIQVASWGFVAAAPDHIERDLAANSLGKVVRGEQDVEDLRNVLKRLEKENSSGIFKGALNLDQVAAEGHSAGGGAAGKFAYDPAVKTFIGQAPVPPLKMAAGASGADLLAAYAATPPPAKPSMIIAGETDLTIPLAGVKQEFDWLAPPKRLAVLAKAGHNAFTDICAPIRAQGGLMQYSGKLPAPDNLLKLGEDGCTSANLDTATGYAIINQLTIAQLRYVFGIDKTDASLSSDYLNSMYPGVLAEYQYVS
jgi:dienelactone hydrolase